MSDEKKPSPGTEISKSVKGPGTVATTQDIEAAKAAFLKTLGASADDIAEVEQTQMGGVTLWIDLKQFQEDPAAPNNKAVKGNGKGWGGFLVGLNDIEVDEDNLSGAEPRPSDGVMVRYFYTIQLTTTCPVVFKDENKVEQSRIAQPGEIVAIGERHQLKQWRPLIDDGGLYWYAVQPHSRIKIGGPNTMWTFNLYKRIVRQGRTVPRVEMIQAPPPRAAGAR